MLRDEMVLASGTFTEWATIPLSVAEEQELPMSSVSSADSLPGALASRTRMPCGRTECEAC